MEAVSSHQVVSKFDVYGVAFSTRMGVLSRAVVNVFPYPASSTEELYVVI